MATFNRSWWKISFRPACRCTWDSSRASREARRDCEANAEVRMRNAEVGMRNAECGMRNEGDFVPHFCFGRRLVIARAIGIAQDKADGSGRTSELKCSKACCGPAW